MGLAFPIGAQQLILHRCTPAGFLLLFLVLGPGNGLCIQIFIRIRDHQFDGLGLRFRFDRPGFGDRSYWIPGSWNLRMSYTDAIPCFHP